MIFNSPVNPKKQKFSLFRMLPAGAEMKLWIKLFKQNWEVRCLPPSPQIFLWKYEALFLFHLHKAPTFNKSTLASDLAKPWEAHWITISSLFPFSSGISSWNLEAERASWHSVVQTKCNVRSWELLWNIHIFTRCHCLVARGHTYLE